jgi:hypothetical protein
LKAWVRMARAAQICSWMPRLSTAVLEPSKNTAGGYCCARLGLTLPPCAITAASAAEIALPK